MNHEIVEVVSLYKSDVTYEIKTKSYPNKTKVFYRNMLMPVNAVPTISPRKNKKIPGMKNKISPERKIKLHKQGAEDPRGTASSSEESDSEYELEFTPNQLLHLR